MAVLLNPVPFWIKYLSISLLLIFWKRVRNCLYPVLANLFNEVCVKLYVEVLFFFWRGGEEFPFIGNGGTVTVMGIVVAKQFQQQPALQSKISQKLYAHLCMYM